MPDKPSKAINSNRLSLLEESDKQNRAILRALPDFLFRFDRKGFFLNVNIIDSSKLLMAPEAFLGKSCNEVLPADLARLTLEMIERAQSTGEMQTYEYSLMKEEDLQYYEARMVSIDRQDTLAVVRNITDRKKAELALQESEERYRYVIEHQGEGLGVVDAEETFTFANPAAHEIFGVPEPGLAGRNLREFVRPEVIPFFLCQTERRRSGERNTYELEIQRPDGQRRTLWITATPQFDREGRFTGTVGIFRNVTDQKRTEEALRESEERYRAVSEHSHTAICIVNQEGKIIWGNDKLVEIGGYSLEEIYQAESFMTFLAPESVPFVVPNFKKVLTGQPYQNHYRFSFLRADGQVRVCDKHMTAYSDVHGQCNVIINMSDVTDQLKAAEDWQQLQAQLAQIQKMESIGRLAGGVAHDFNNMLSVILGYSEWAKNQLDPVHPVAPALQEICKAARRSADLTQQLLAFARKQPISPKVIRLNDIVEDMLKMLRRLLGETIALVLIPGRDLWPLCVDPSQIDQILANLCVNARDAIGERGRVQIETGNVCLEKGFFDKHGYRARGEYVSLAVTDTGCGMSRETLEQLFEPFFTTKETGKGTGLGLATVYGIVKQNSGWIDVSSDPGKGSTFRIYLPRHRGDLESPEESPDTKPTGGGHETVLLVEDETSILEISRMMLETLGYNVLSAGTPRLALELAGRFCGQIHVLMTDVIMPEQNGQDLARELMLSRPDLKVLFMSGYADDVITDQTVSAEQVVFLPKPFSMSTLAEKISQALGK